MIILWLYISICVIECREQGGGGGADLFIRGNKMNALRGSLNKFTGNTFTDRSPHYVII